MSPGTGKLGWGSGFFGEEERGRGSESVTKERGRKGYLEGRSASGSHPSPNTPPPHPPPSAPHRGNTRSCRKLLPPHTVQCLPIPSGCARSTGRRRGFAPMASCGQLRRMGDVPRAHPRDHLPRARQRVTHPTQSLHPSTCSCQPAVLHTMQSLHPSMCSCQPASVQCCASTHLVTAAALPAPLQPGRTTTRGTRCCSCP